MLFHPDRITPFTLDLWDHITKSDTHIFSSLLNQLPRMIESNLEKKILHSCFYLCFYLFTELKVIKHLSELVSILFLALILHLQKA